MCAIEIQLSAKYQSKGDWKSENLGRTHFIT